VSEATRNLPEPPSVDLMQFEVRSRLEVVALLRALQEGKVLITAYFGAGDLLLTDLVAVHPESDEIVFGLGRDQAANLRLLASDEIVFVAAPDGIKMQFYGSAPRALQAEGYPAFAVPIPNALLRLQRREYFRVPTPLARPLVCTAESPEVPGERIDLTLVEISCGGLGAMVDTRQLRPEKGMLLTGCELKLPETEPMRMSLEIRHVLESTRDRRGRARIGCRFVGLPRRLSTVLQRFVNKLQREWLARS
jgi:c-di-GMP-binding flagellar brake protein YcgR